MTERVHVVGGGIVGASVAYHLSLRPSLDVTLVEAGDVAGETTAKSGAFVGYWGFEDAGYRALKEFGVELYNDFLADPRADHSFDIATRLGLATTPAGAAELRASVPSDAADDALVAYVDGADLPSEFVLPDVETGAVTGAVFRPRIGYFDPVPLAEEFLTRAVEGGVTVRTSSSVMDVHARDGAVTGLTVDGDRVDSDAVVCAAGPWSRRLARQVGVDVPIRHTLAPVMRFEPNRPLTGAFPSVKHVESGVYFRREADDTVFAGHYPGDYHEAGTEYDPDAVSTSVPDDVESTIRETLESLLAVESLTLREETVGVRSLTPDHDPIVGYTDVEGFYLTAVNAAGIQLAPVIGHVVAAQLADGDRTEYYDTVSISRFEGHTDVTQ